MKHFLITATIAAAASVAAAQTTPTISSQSIIVNPVKPDLQVNVWTAKDTTGTKVPTYVAGEHITLNVKTNQDAYVYLFNVDGKGNVDLILPNRFASGENFVRANTTKAFPSQQDKFTFDIAGPAGVNKVLALASKTKLNLDDIAQFKADQKTGFATVTVSGQTGLAQALSIVVKPLPSKDWVTDVAQYQISSKVATPPVPTTTTTTSWKSTFQSTLSLRETYNFYANQLKAQGYVAGLSTTSPGQMTGDFTYEQGVTAKLTVKRRAQSMTYDVVIQRQTKS
ncbi:DUF4384 domain-containing protein [Deinococcus maricopensis]|uniref:Putative S-layer-like protein array-related protein n=1 Tax=Deinococcus maricopensis (strain DSM 21211 / LMG 22137 / NRRL B-23946 / LB-34) TaxID=709986 RepID=E8U8U9_DEIML|nr:DUF4384 domain-containing protein [Deinococcus maricopensis]ADV67488.1 putative S-layer-like protein array-related protein, precursor [Deinococcus maricopensis DSM 21211]